MDAADAARPGAGRGRPRPGLSRTLIVEAALAIVDEQGLAAASMRTLARRLGVQAMSLYKHVPDRDALFDLVVDRIVTELDADPDVEVRPGAAGWRDWLAGLARGVRRYARGHPHAFPLVATRPPTAPWINPPLRSLRWVEAMLDGLSEEGFSDEQVLFSYRVFNSFLLGYLLLETSAMTLRDPKPGDGAFTTGQVGREPGAERGEPAASADPVPGGLAPTRDPEVRERIAQADGAEVVDPVGQVDGQRYPTVNRLAAGLAEDRWDTEFEEALQSMLDRIESFVGGRGTTSGSELTP
jgi:AcrR family transcriptional regulator